MRTFVLVSLLLAPFCVAQELEPCNCKLCQGDQVLSDVPKSGFKGFQCQPTEAAITLGSCNQQGEPEDWVVQTAQDITYERYCHFTCKPAIPKEIVPHVSCIDLTKDEKMAQSALKPFWLKLFGSM